MKYGRFWSWSRSSFLALTLLVGVVLTGRGAFAEESNDGFALVESHYAVLIANHKRIGRCIQMFFKKGEGDSALWKTEEEMTLALKRVNKVIEEHTKKTVIEDASGIPQEFRFTMNFQDGEAGTTLTGKREGNVFVLSTAGREQKIPVDTEALGPAALERLTKEKLPLKEGAKLELKTFSAESPQTVGKMTSTVMRRENKTLLDGKVESLWLVEQTESMLPGEIFKCWMNDAYDSLVVSMPFPGIGQTDLYEVPKSEMAQPLEPIEVFAASFIYPTGKMADDRQSQLAIYHLKLPPGKNIQLWNGETQKVTLKGDNEADVEITTETWDVGRAESSLPLTVPDELKDDLAPNTEIESDNPKIIALAKEAVGTEKNPVLAARKIEGFVRRYIRNKNLDSTFATALEAAESRSGDCTEHAVLVAALCRASGIPARVVVGLVHIPAPPGAEKKLPNGLFGFHMWAEAWIGPNQWMPLDAALGSFSVSHIAISKSSLAGPSPLIDLSTGVIQMMDGLKIDVAEMK